LCGNALATSISSASVDDGRSTAGRYANIRSHSSPAGRWEWKPTSS
jgi:hypothetical protein